MLCLRIFSVSLYPRGWTDRQSRHHPGHSDEADIPSSTHPSISDGYAADVGLVDVSFSVFICDHSFVSFAMMGGTSTSPLSFFFFFFYVVIHF